ncbi:SEC-C metal-binding domain-containing protein [Nocardioides sp. 31GB23]|uniref:SEC-C metal-binding domain-containing protein n=1 Tax=Nocardioides sp. 31GB23 TaxID=3156065 RepID=UPI0032AFADF7
MTMIGFATYGDHAEFITDTANYTKYVESLGTTTKHITINHIDAACLTQGDGHFGDLAMSALLQVAGQVVGFDELTLHAPKWLDEMHVDAERPENCLVFLIGYSEEAGEFVAYVYASEQGFKRVKVSRWIFPAPWNLQPSGIELRRTRRYIDQAEQSRVDLWPQVEASWTKRPKMTAPASVEEWVELAKSVREQRCLDDFAQIIVHGKVVHTRLERGTVASSVVHDFGSDDTALLKMLRGTRHPFGQMQACWCGSGETYRDCHLRWAWDQPCGCHKGEKLFKDCHMVPPSAEIGVIAGL